MAMLKVELEDLIRAGFSGLWIETCEAEEAQREVANLCREQEWICLAWDAGRGLTEAVTGKPAGTQDTNPIAALKYFQSQPAVPERDHMPRLMLLHNFHRFLESPVVMQHLTNAVVWGKGQLVSYLILSPITEMPVEVSRLFTVVRHPLPVVEELKKIADSLTELPAAVEEQTCRAALGMTRREAENAFSLSHIKHYKVDPEVIWTLKAQALEKSSGLELYRGKEDFESLAGLEGLKDFTRGLLTGSGRLDSRGILLLGPPGTGKSAIAKALGNEVGRPTVLMDVGGMYHKHVGETESRIRMALESVDAMGECIVFIDEIEKALSGVSSDGDSGVSNRLFGTLLTWLSDRSESGECQSFFVATANDIKKLPPEFSRPERFDGIFFIDLPSLEERIAIWELYLHKYKVDDHPSFNDAGWTGAEVKACCRLAKMLQKPLNEAAEHVVPVSMTAAEKVLALREWAQDRCLSASTGKRYRIEQSEPLVAGDSRRKLLKPQKEKV